MSRPFALIGFTYIAALFLAACFSSNSLLIGIAFFIIFVISLSSKTLRAQKRTIIIFLTAAIAFLVFNIFSSVEAKNTQKLVGHDATITGVICEAPVESYGKQYYVIKTESVSIDGLKDIPQKIKVRVSKTTAFDCDVFDKITGKIHFYEKESHGIFSSKNYYAARGIHNFAYFFEYENYDITKTTIKPPYYYFIKCKQALISSLREIFPKRYYSIASGILLGDKYFIDDEVMSDFENIGISHLLSVSGLHVSIISHFFFKLFLALKLSKRKSYLLTGATILSFMAIVGFAPSVVRASIMLIIAHAGKAFFKNSDSLNSLGFATLVLTAFNPFAGCDVGLLLSITATLGIILFSDKINNLVLSKIKNSENLNSSIKKVISLVCVTVSATIITIPITVFYFKKVSFISLLANIIMVTPAMIVLILTLVIAVLNMVGFLRFIVMPLGLFNAIIIEYLINCAKILASVPFASSSTAQPFLLFWAASTLLVFAADLLLNKELKIRTVPILLSISILLVGILSYQVAHENITTLTAVDIGTGCSAVLSKNGHAALLACGGDHYESSKLTKYLENINIKKLDYLVLSDLKEKSSCYAKDIISKYKPSHVVLPDHNDVDSRLSRTIADSSNACYFNEKANLKCWDDIDVTVMNNNEHGFIYLTVNGVNTLICPSGGVLSDIPAEYSLCDIFIEGVYPEELNAINAAYMIMSNKPNLVKSKITDVVKSGKIPMATGGDGHVAIDFIKNNTVSFRRVRQ